MKLIAVDYEGKDIIKIIREWSELNQRDFAKSVGMTERVIQSYEQGTRKYKFETLMRIAKIHNVKITFEKRD